MDNETNSNLAYCYCYGNKNDILNLKQDLDLFAGYFYGDDEKVYKEDFMFFFDKDNPTLTLSLKALTNKHQEITIHLVDNCGLYEIHSKGTRHKVINGMVPVEKFYKLKSK